MRGRQHTSGCNQWTILVLGVLIEFCVYERLATPCIQLPHFTTNILFVS